MNGLRRFQCRWCGSEQLRITDEPPRVRKRNGARRTQRRVECLDCDMSWWSYHREPLAAAPAGAA